MSSITPGVVTEGDEQDEGALSMLVPVDDDGPGGSKGLFSRGERDLTKITIDPATLRRNLESTLDALRSAFEGLSEVRAGLPLKEVQVSFEVSATGKVTVLGTGAEVSGAGGITLTFGK